MEDLADNTKVNKVKEREMSNINIFITADDIKASSVRVETFNDRCTEILEHRGKESQLRQLAEECTELAKEALKAIRGDSDNRDAIIEEIADVEIMIKQTKIAFDIKPEEICKVMSEKLSRERARIKAEIGED